MLWRQLCRCNKNTFQRLLIPPYRSSPTRKARGSNPPGRTKSSTLWGAALFVLHGFYGAVKERIRTALAPRFASRALETPRWGVSRARLGESLRTRKKRIAMYFCNAFFVLMLFRFRIISVAYHLRHQCIALLPAVHFSVDLQWYA